MSFFICSTCKIRDVQFLPVCNISIYFAVSVLGINSSGHQLLNQDKLFWDFLYYCIRELSSVLRLLANMEKINANDYIFAIIREGWLRFMGKKHQERQHSHCMLLRRLKNLEVLKILYLVVLYLNFQITCKALSGLLWRITCALVVVFYILNFLVTF